MAMFTLSVFVNRSQREVFDLLSRPENIHQPISLMQPAAWTCSGGLGIGSTGRRNVKWEGQAVDLTPEVTRWSPPNCYGIRILNTQIPFEAMEYVYTLVPEDGGTRITLECESEWVRLH